MTAVPKDLPALLRAHRLLERASQFKVTRETPGDLLEEICQSAAQMKALQRQLGEQESAAAQIGHLLFSLAKLSRLWGLNAEHLLRGVNQDFVDRFHRTETALRDQGKDIEKATPEEIHKAWANARPRRPEPSKRKPLSRRLIRWLALAAAMVIGITVCQVLLVRFLDPPYTVKMAIDRLLNVGGTNQLILQAFNGFDWSTSPRTCGVRSWPPRTSAFWHTTGLTSPK